MTAAHDLEEFGDLLPPVKRPLRTKDVSLFLLRILLFIAGLNLAIWGGRLALTRIQSVVATEAFVNGRIVTINAPVEGQVVMAEPLRSGLPVGLAQPLAQIINPDLDPWLRDAEFELAAERSRLQSLIAQLSDRQLALPPSRELNLYQSQVQQHEATIELAAQGVRQAELRHQSAQADAAQAQRELARLLPLAEQGVIPVQQLDVAETDWTISQQQVRQAEIEIQNKRLELENFQQQAALLIPPWPGPSQEQVGILEIQHQIQEVRHRIAAREQAIAAAQLDPKHQDQTLLPPFAGVVWESLIGPAERVTLGQPMLRLLDCQQLWIDAFVSIDELPRLELGSLAKVKLYNGSLTLEGRVATVRSRLTGLQTLGQDSAINPPDLAQRQVAQLRIELDHPEQLIAQTNSAAAFCNVGQIAQVEIVANR